MYQRYPNPPGAARLKGDWCRRPLSPLPNTPFLTVILQYRPEQTFELFSRYGIQPEKVVKITVIEPIDVGYDKFSQSFKARVIEGSPHLVDKTIFAKFYDPLYINPDDILTICIFYPLISTNVSDPETDSSGPSGSSSSADSTKAEMLAGIVELSRKNSAASTRGDTLVDSVELEKGSDGAWKFKEEIGEGVDRGVSEEEIPDKVRPTFIADLSSEIWFVESKGYSRNDRGRSQSKECLYPENYSLN